MVRWHEWLLPVKAVLETLFIPSKSQVQSATVAIPAASLSSPKPPLSASPNRISNPTRSLLKQADHS